MKKRLVSIFSISTLFLAIGLISSSSVGAAESQSVEDIKAYGALDSHTIYADPNPDAEVNNGFNFNLKTVTIKKSYPGTDYILNGSYGSTPSFTGGLQDTASGKKRVWLTVHNLDEATCALVRCKVKSLATDWRTTLIKGESVTSKNEYLTHTDFYSEDISWNTDDQVKWLTVLSPDRDSSLLTVIVKVGTGSWRHFITVRYSAIYPRGLAGGYSSINEPGVNNPFISRIAVFQPTLMERFSGRGAEFGRLYLLGPSGKNRHSYVVRGSELIASVGLEPQLEGKSEYRLNLGALTEQIDYSGGKNLAESTVDAISDTAKSYRQSVRDQAKLEAKAKMEGEARAKAASIPYLSEANYAPYITFWWNAPSYTGMTWLTRDVTVTQSGDASYFSIMGSFSPPFYLGIQDFENDITGLKKKVAIFSAWDSYENNNCTNCGPETRPIEGRTIIKEIGPGVTPGQFGYEGTGVNAFINDFGWKVGDKIRAVVNLRQVTDGTEISAALQINSEKWRYFGTYKYSKIYSQIGQSYSFIEDFGQTPMIVRSAEFGNTWMESEDLTSTVPITAVSAIASRGGSQNDSNIPYHLITQKKNTTLWAQTGGDEFISKKAFQAVIATPTNYQIPIEARIATLNLAGEKALAYTLNYSQNKSRAEAKSAAELKTKQEAEAKAAAELKAKQEADAKLAKDAQTKAEADAKLAKDAQTKAEADARLAKDAGLTAEENAQNSRSELRAAKDALAKSEGAVKTSSESSIALTKEVEKLQKDITNLSNQISTLSASLSSLQTSNTSLTKKLTAICKAKPKPKGC